MRVARPNRRYQAALWIDRRLGPLLVRAARRLAAALPGAGAAAASREREEDPRAQALGHGQHRAGVAAARAPARAPPAGAHRLRLAARERPDPLAAARRSTAASRSSWAAAYRPSSSPPCARCATLRRERYDLLYDLEFFTRFSAIFSSLARARRSHGFSSKSQWRGRLHDVQVPFNAYHHVALNFLTLLRDDPMDPIDTAPIDGDAALPPLRAPAGAWEACCETPRRRSGVARERADRRHQSERGRHGARAALAGRAGGGAARRAGCAPRSSTSWRSARRPSASTSSP